MTQRIDVESIDSPASAGLPGGPPKRRPLWLYYSIIGVAAIIVFGVFASRFGEDPRITDSPLVGKPLPPLTLEYLEQDGSLDFADLKGQALVINFWASWCFPCRAEHPALTEAAVAYADEGVHFVGIVYQDTRNNASGFLDQFGRGTNYSYVMDNDSRTIIDLGVFGVPETYFVDKNGIIRSRYQGAVDPAILKTHIEEALAPLTP
jgi:cytochrome c biogenesis protein CcmG/thiol:disulfide interchange protein DsbE